MTTGIRLGTSAFTVHGWPGSFYPEGMTPLDYLDDAPNVLPDAPSPLWRIMHFSPMN